MKAQKNKKEFFSLGLYVEALRRIRLPAIILFLITAAVGVLVPISCVTEDIRYAGSSVGIAPTHIDAMTANPLLLILIFVTAPVLTYTLFSFMNHRNASDMYSSMPHTRLSQYISRVAALASAFAAITVASSAISSLILVVFRSHFVVSWNSFPSYMFGCFVGACLVSSVMCIAMSITGNLFNNIIVSALIMFMPRFVLLFVSLGVIYGFPLISSTHGFWATSLHNNIITGFFDYIINYYNGGSLSLLETVPQLYSISLALIYFVLGAVLFGKRQSESAERAAPSEWLRGIYRVILTMVICVPACLLMFISMKDSSYSVGIITYIWLYVAALIVFFTYELITTKKWKSIKRALPSLVIVILLNVALLGSMELCCGVEKNFSPSADSIQYISIIPADNDTPHYFSEYAQSMTSNVHITDSNARIAVSEALSNGEERLKELDRTSYYSFSQSYSKITVKIKAGFSTKYRELYFSDAERETLYSALAKNDDFKNCYMNLPEAEKNSIYTELSSDSSDRDRLEEIYGIMRDEVATLSFDEWYEYLRQNYTDTFANFQIGVDGRYITLPVSYSLLPKTAEALMRLRNDSCTVSAESVIDAMKTSNIGDYSNIGNNGKLVMDYATYYPAKSDCVTWISTADTKLLADCLDISGELDTSHDIIALNLIIPEKYNEDDLITEYSEHILYIPAAEDAKKALIEAGLIDEETEQYGDVEISYSYN